MMSMFSFFFFKQKTAYEMRISDWSSDVCSSDLRIVYHQLRVEWTAGPKETNGAYGIYPVESSDVLIDSVYVRGASDAGIYVGQSKNIVVRDSIVMENVAGIEIENCYDADVHDNVETKNTGGILDRKRTRLNSSH